MATLTEISVVARKGVKWGIVALIIMMLIPLTIRLGRQFYTQLNPPPPPAPTVRYGKLPQLVFPPASDYEGTEFKLETIEGGLPQLDSQGRVYLVGINKSRLLTLDRIKEKARLLGFVNDPVPLDEQTYRFIHPQLPAELIANIISGGFSYRFDWTTDSSIYSNTKVPTGNQAIAEAKGWLQDLGLLPADLAAGEGKVQYFTATGSAIVPAETFYDANFTRADLFREGKDDFRVMTAGGDTSPVNVLISGLTTPKRVIQANYQHSVTLDNDFATYPLKSVTQAWNELVSGQGYLAKRAGSDVVVRKISFAYYESNDPQPFLQPIFVFEGDNGFIGYVQAVDSQFVVQ